MLKTNPSKMSYSYSSLHNSLVHTFFPRLTRVYWSTVNPKKRCVYTCWTEEVDRSESSGKFAADKDNVIADQGIEEHTVTCHEGSSDIRELSKDLSEHKKKWRLLNSANDTTNSTKRNGFLLGSTKRALERPTATMVHLNKPKEDNSKLRKLLHGSSPNVAQADGVTEGKDSQKGSLRISPKTKNAHNVSAMDVLVNLTQENSNLLGTSSSSQPSLASRVSQMPTKKSTCDSVTRQSKMYSEIFPKTSVKDSPSLSLSSRATAYHQTSRTKPLPLAPKPVPYVPKPVQLNPKPVPLNPKPIPLAPKPANPRFKSDVFPLSTCQVRFSQPSSMNAMVHLPSANFQQNYQRSSEQNSGQNSLEISQQSSQPNSQRKSQTNSKTVDSGNLAVVVGSPEQITKLLSENPSMIQLLGSKSTAYLGELLSSSTSTKLQDSQVKEPEKSIKSLASQNKCMNAFPNIRNINSGMPRSLLGTKRNQPKIEQTSSRAEPAVIDLTKEDNQNSESTSLRESIHRSNFPLTTVNNATNIPNSRKIVRKLDRRCLNEHRENTTGSNEHVKSGKKVDVINLDDTIVSKPQSFLGASPALPLSPKGLHAQVNSKMNHQYIFSNRRFMHASLDKPCLEKKANKVSPLSSPAKMIANVESQSINLKPLMASSLDENSANSKKSGEPKRKDGVTSEIPRTSDEQTMEQSDPVLKKENFKACNEKVSSSVKESRRKHLDKINANDKKCRGETTKKKNHLKRKSDCDSERPLKKAKIDGDRIVLPDFERTRQPDNKNKRLENVDMESSILFTITSDEGFEVKARTCEGMCKRNLAGRAKVGLKFKVQSLSLVSFILRLVMQNNSGLCSDVPISQQNMSN